VQAGLTQIKDIIDDVRHDIKFIMVYESRLNVLSEIVKRLNIHYKKLILNVSTHWNNTYVMLNTTIRFKEVFPRYQRVEKGYQWGLSLEQWEIVDNVT
jgi:hypothetical protein